MTPRERVRQLSQQYLAKGDFSGWHEEIYAGAQGESSGIPWADLVPNPFLVEWISMYGGSLYDKRALVVGCDLGDDAEYLAGLGIQTTAFDISPTAIDWCKQRFPDSSVTYTIANTLHPPDTWREQFDLVVEIYTLQVLPAEIRPHGMEALAGCLKKGGRLFIFARGREDSEPLGGVPWPLTRAELDEFIRLGLQEMSFEDFIDGDTRRFRVIYQHV
jgi:2-polyprenyl-3-methyl-5-hydroxy-6-metoxy-1,4-benzoquinol methylase